MIHDQRLAVLSDNLRVSEPPPEEPAAGTLLLPFTGGGFAGLFARAFWDTCLGGGREQCIITIRDAACLCFSAGGAQPGCRIIGMLVQRIQHLADALLLLCAVACCFDNLRLQFLD